MPGKYADQMNEKRSVPREITGYSTTSNAYGKHNNNHPNMQNNKKKKRKIISNAYWKHKQLNMQNKGIYKNYFD